MMSRMVPKPFSLFSHSWILSRLRLSLRAVNESSKTPAVFLWATEDVSFGEARLMAGTLSTTGFLRCIAA